MKKLLLAILILLGGFQSVFAACFVMNKNGNVRSGPSMKHEIIGYVKKWQVIELPRGGRWHGNWLCIEKRMPYATEKVQKKGWSTFMSLGEWGDIESRANDPNKTIVIINLRDCEEKRGAFVEFTGEERTEETMVSKEVVYQPVRERTEKKYIHKSLGRIVPGTSFDVRKQISVTKENKSWEKRSRDEFLKDEIKIGMNKSQVWALWGRPDDINRTVSAYGIREQWIYGDTVLYFDNGKLTSWQE